MKSWKIYAFVLVLCAYSMTVFAQSIAPNIKGEHELLKTAPNATIGTSEKRCGDYFVFTSEHVTQEGKVPGISYLYGATNWGQKGKHRGALRASKVSNGNR